MTRNKTVNEMLAIFALSLATVALQPAILMAQTPNYNPVNFTEPLKLSRGEISPRSPDAQRLPLAEGCNFAAVNWGWNEESCNHRMELFAFGTHPGVDLLLVNKPETEGYVEMDDWDEDVDEKIEGIWQGLVEGSAEQGERLGVKIEPKKWVVYPTLDRARATLHYAYLVEWDGEPSLNVDAMVFDRRGFVKFALSPDDTNAGQAEIQGMLNEVVASYAPAPEEGYTDFKLGDKVAVVGVLGVLAGALGVKYGKAAATGMFAVALVALKKFWWILLIVPAALWKWGRGMFGR